MLISREVTQRWRCDECGVVSEWGSEWRTRWEFHNMHELDVTVCSAECGKKFDARPKRERLARLLSALENTA